MLFGYARVSRLDQDLSIQIKSLIDCGVDERNIYKEKVSALSPSRPKLKKLLEFAEKDDTIAVYKLDRLGRSVVHLINIINDLNERGINFISLTENIDMKTASGKLQFNMLASLAQYTRELIRERTLEGLQLAREKGKILGRRSMLNKMQRKQIDEMHLKGTSKYDMAKILGLGSRSPIYTYLNNKDK